MSKKAKSKPKPKAWEYFVIPTVTHDQNVTRYNISLGEEVLLARRFSEFESLAKELNTLNLDIDVASLPSKFTMFTKKDDSFFETRRGKLEILLQRVIEEVIVKDSAKGQMLVKDFVGLAKEVKLVEFILKYDKAEKEKRRRERKKLEENERDIESKEAEAASRQDPNSWRERSWVARNKDKLLECKAAAIKQESERKDILASFKLRYKARETASKKD